MGIVADGEKSCDTCGTSYPNTVEYFRPTGSGVPRATCKECDRLADRQRWHGKREPLALIPSNAGQFYDHERDLYNLTAMWRAAGCPQSKRPSKWAETEQYKEFVAELNVRNTDIQSDRGGAGGTWGHWQIAVEYAGYLSPAFKVQWNEYAAAYIRGEQRSAIVPTQAPYDIVSVVQPIRQEISEVRGDVLWIRQKLETVGELHHFHNMPGGAYIARFVIEEFTNPADRLERFGVQGAAQHLANGYVPACVGKFSGNTPFKRIQGHHGKLLIDDISYAIHWMLSDYPSTAESHLRATAPLYPIAYKLIAKDRKLKDWFWVKGTWLDAFASEPWPARVLLVDLAASCKGWRFDTATVYRQEVLL